MSSEELVIIASRPISKARHAPYLVANAQTFESDRAKRQWYKRQWISCSPNIRDSLKGKMAWMASIGSSYQMEQARLNWFVPSPNYVVTQVFFDLAPPLLEIELYCTKANLCNIMVGDSGLFASNCRKFCQQTYPGPPTWSDYAEWLTALDSDIVLLGSIACKKTDQLRDKTSELIEGLSIDGSLDSYWFMHAETFAKDPSIAWWSLTSVVGQNLYYQSPTSRCAVQLQVYFTQPSSNRLTNTNFLRRLNHKGRYSRETVGTHYDYMVVPKAGRDVKVLGSIEKAKLEDNFDILWLGYGFKQQIQRITDHFSGKGETIDLEVFMHKGPKESAMAILMICTAEIKFLELFRSKNEQLVAAMALTVSFSDISPLWIHCKAVSNEAASVVGKLGEIWRLHILAANNSILGITNQQIRSTIYRALHLREQIFACSGLEFDWQPAPKAPKVDIKRKRDTSPDSVLINEIVDEALRTM